MQGLFNIAEQCFMHYPQYRNYLGDLGFYSDNTDDQTGTDDGGVQCRSVTLSKKTF
ncbi:predicted protein [Botrytis cinerea T4]|uniref:Uncharacterized protein n=1 Tax=Botryotinia fuckeliana (strain T4) TaxID=999810 RepID=G2YCK4_BOTF4|nr:predicted protein [Botrytis cinerea T4]